MRSLAAELFYASERDCSKQEQAFTAGVKNTRGQWDTLFVPPKVDWPGLLSGYFPVKVVIENADKICGSGLLCHMVAGNFFQLLPVIFPADGNYSTDVALHAVPGRRKMGGDISIKGTRYGEEAFLILKGQGNRINGVLESTVFWPDSQGHQQGTNFDCFSHLDPPPI